MGYWSDVGKAILGRVTPGKYYWSILEGTISWSKKNSSDKKIKLILENPSALYIFTLLCDLATLGRFCVLDEDGTEVDGHPILDLLHKPNFFQTQQQFVWDYMFHRKMGTANLYIDRPQPVPQNVMYWIQSDHIKWPQQFQNQRYKLVLSEETINEMGKQQLTYQAPGQNYRFPYSKLLQFHDLSNGLEGWFKSPSRVDALYKIISNSENSLVSKNINSRFMSKFIVSGDVSVQQTTKLMMGEQDKKNVREAMNSDETIFPTKTMVSISRFIENAQVLKSLDDSFMTDCFLIGKVLNIPKDVIEMLGDSTYENQEKATAKMVSYCLQPDMDDFANGLWKYYQGEENLSLIVKYDHLPFVQVFERERADTDKAKSDAFDKYVRAGADPEEVAAMLDIPLETFDAPTTPTQQTAQEAQLEQLRLAK